MAGSKEIRAPRGADLNTQGWSQEGALRMLMNNLDPEVAEKPDELIVYGGTGKAARNWECFHAIVDSLTGHGDVVDIIHLGRDGQVTDSGHEGIRGSIIRLAGEGKVVTTIV